MKIEHHYNLQTKSCIDNIIELAVSYVKNFKKEHKTCYNDVNVD